MFKEFTSAFDEAEVLILLDIYEVSGRDDLSHNKGCNKLLVCRKTSLSSKDLTDSISRRLSKSKNIKLKRVLYLPYSAKLRSTIVKTIKEYQRKSVFYPHKSAVIIMMGAGDIVNLTSKLIDA